MRPLQAHCHLGLGTLYARWASGAGPCRLTAAIDLYRAMDMTSGSPRRRRRWRK